MTGKTDSIPLVSETGNLQQDKPSALLPCYKLRPRPRRRRGYTANKWPLLSSSPSQLMSNTVLGNENSDKGDRGEAMIHAAHRSRRAASQRRRYTYECLGGKNQNQSRHIQGTDHMEVLKGVVWLSFCTDDPPTPCLSPGDRRSAIGIGHS